MRMYHNHWWTKSNGQAKKQWLMDFDEFSFIFHFHLWSSKEFTKYVRIESQTVVSANVTNIHITISILGEFHHQTKNSIIFS